MKIKTTLILALGTAWLLSDAAQADPFRYPWPSQNGNKERNDCKSEYKKASEQLKEMQKTADILSKNAGRIKEIHKRVENLKLGLQIFQKFLAKGETLICTSKKESKKNKNRMESSIMGFKQQIEDIKSNEEKEFANYPVRCEIVPGGVPLDSVVGIYQPLNRQPAVINPTTGKYYPTSQKLGCTTLGDDCVISVGKLGRDCYNFYQDTIDAQGNPSNTGKKQIVCIDQSKPVACPIGRRTK